MTMLSNSNLDEKAELIFDLYDFDGSQYISRDELVILMTNALSALNAMSKQKPPTVNEIELRLEQYDAGRHRIMYAISGFGRRIACGKSSRWRRNVNFS